MISLLVLALAPTALFAARLHQAEVAASGANPIRKVVKMLQDMQAKVTEEGEKEEELYDKFMCYCKNNKGTLSAGIEQANGKVEALDSSIGESTEKKAQTEQALKEHQASRDEAKEAMATATSVREKEAAAFAAEDAEAKANIAALTKAISAIEKGMAGTFLQTVAANSLKKFVIEKAVLSDDARQDLLSFLSGSEGYSPRSGSITGILKQLKDNMSKGHEEAIAAEEEAIKSHEALMAAKSQEVSVLTGQVEAETKRVGELGVEIAGMTGDLEDTKESLAADTQFLDGLDSSCETKSKEWEEVKATRADELVALAETIKVLNDDDALELFKKTLPSASSSFVQLNAKAASLRARALALLRGAGRGRGGSPASAEPEPVLGAPHACWERQRRMGQAFTCPAEGKFKEEEDRFNGRPRPSAFADDVIGSSGAAAVAEEGGEGQGKAAAPPPPPPPDSWDPIDARGCDAELVVIAAIQAFAPAGLRRYLTRRGQLVGSRCFDYETNDSGFRIVVPSHALTIDTDIKKWRGKVENDAHPDGSVVFVRAIGSTCLARVEAGDGDRSRLRVVSLVAVEED